MWFLSERLFKSLLERIVFYIFAVRIFVRMYVDVVPFTCSCVRDIYFLCNMYFIRSYDNKKGEIFFSL